VDEKGGKLYFTGTKDDVLAPQVYALDYAHLGGQPQRLTELGFANGASVDRSADAAGQPQRPGSAAAGLSGRHHRQAPDLGGREQGRGRPSLCALHGGASHAHLRHDQGGGRHRSALQDDHPVMQPGKVYPVFFEHYGGPIRRW
jgi:dipeptidyl-peptidase-4